MSSSGQCFDIGCTVRQAIHRFGANEEPVAGSIMRLAPIPLYYLPNPAAALTRSQVHLELEIGAAKGVGKQEEVEQ